MNLPISRRQFVTAAAGATAACLLPWSLAGCAANGDAPDDNQAANSNQDAAASAQASPESTASRFDPASFDVTDALGETYQQALAKVQELAPDALLFALRFSHAVAPGEPISWDYMFASQQNLRYYIAFTGSMVSASELGDCTMKFAEWANVPAVDTIKVDAAAAYASVCEAAAEMAAPKDLYAYLILYSEEADTASTEYSYVDEPMNWYFEFSFEDAEASGESEGGAAEAEGAGDGGAASEGTEGGETGETGSADAAENGTVPPTQEEDDQASLTVYSVNAKTGETLWVVE